MRISDILSSKKLTLSFEVFPPKTETSYDSVVKATEEIAQLNPDFISVTYGAGGGTSKYTLQIAENIEKRYHITVLTHVTCVSSSKETVHNYINNLKNAGIENIMALRGDLLPGKENEDRSRWDYAHAVDLIKELREDSSNFTIGGACYPEIHPESANQQEDIMYLKQKADAGCDFLTTQMFFDNHLLYNFLFKIREAGITIPVIPGIMPITNANQIERAIKLSGSHMPQRFLSLLDRFGNKPSAMKQAGIAYATDQIIDLYANGIRNIHVYTMNKPDVAARIKDNLSEILEIDND